MTVTHLAPPSVQLVPAKEYNGAPIGTSYDIRAYVADRPDEKLHRRSTVRMGIRVLQRAAAGIITTAPTSPQHQNDSKVPSTIISTREPYEEPEPPHASVDKPFLLSDGKVELEASLNKAIYNHGDSVMVNVTVRNNSGKTVRRIKVFIVQHVDVCMFSNGKFKNVVALINSKEECPLAPWTSLNRTYLLQPAKGATKNWIALEDSFSKKEAALASTVICPSNNPEDRNVFAIYVSYYVKVKLLVGAMGGELSLKLPFTLVHSADPVTETAVLPQAKLSPDKDEKPRDTRETKEAKESAELNKDEVRVESHDPTAIRNLNNITANMIIRKPKKKTTIEDENEIIRLEDEGAT